MIYFTIDINIKIMTARQRNPSSMKNRRKQDEDNNTGIEGIGRRGESQK